MTSLDWAEQIVALLRLRAGFLDDARTDCVGDCVAQLDDMLERYERELAKSKESADA